MNKNISLILLLLLTVSSFTTLAQYSVNGPGDCDNIIRTTYDNNPRDYVRRATTENAQRCLADAGFWDYRDGNGNPVFTGIYLDNTIRNAESYLSRGSKTNQDAENAKKAEAAKVEAARIEQEKIELQRKADELKAQNQVNTQSNVTNSTSATNNVSASTQASIIPLNANGSLNTTPNNTKVAALPKNETISDSREPASADKFLLNTIYFLFALPFILFAISIVAAFLKVFKKPNE